MWKDIENKIILYAGDTTLYAEVAFPFNRINVVNFLDRDLFKYQSWCLTWGIKLNLRKTHSINISRSLPTSSTINFVWVESGSF